MIKGLGRLIEFDERSRQFPIRELIRKVAQPRSYTWSCSVTLDQGTEGTCVGHAFAHEAIARPAKVKNVNSAVAIAVYKRAQQLDDYPGENYSGTSILAGAKACVEREWYASYRWAFGLDDVILALGYKGPVVLGVNWYDEGMGRPDRNGMIRVTGKIDGGHAILATGVHIKRKLIRLHNSWGPGYGINGDCFISFADLDRLLHEEGEACIPIGRKS